MTIFGVIEL